VKEELHTDGEIKLNNKYYKNHKWMYIPRAFLPCLPGFMSGISCMLIKANAMAVMTASESDNFLLPITYILMVASLTSSVSQTLIMNYAFHHFP